MIIKKNHVVTAAERDFDEVQCIVIVDLYYRFLIEIYILGLVVTSCHIMKKKWLSPLMTINLRNKTESIHLHDNNLHKNDLSIINKKKYVSRFNVFDFYCNPFPATHDFAKAKM